MPTIYASQAPLNYDVTDPQYAAQAPLNYNAAIKINGVQYAAQAPLDYSQANNNWD